MKRLDLKGDYEIDTKKYIKTIIKKLSDTNGDIPDEYSASLYLIADNYDTYIKVKKIISEEGVMIVDRFGSKVPNPLLKTANDSQIQLQKLIIEFGLTKKSAQKLNEDIQKEADSPLINFIKGQKETR